jgi:hypothetical protein
VLVALVERDPGDDYNNGEDIRIGCELVAVP